MSGLTEAKHRLREQAANDALDGNGAGPDDPNMNERVAKLEAKWEAVIPTLATKADFVELNGDMKAELLATKVELIDSIGKLSERIHGVETTFTRWMVGLFIAGVTIAASGVAIIITVLKPTQTATTPAPIIVNVPAQLQPAPPAKP